MLGVPAAAEYTNSPTGSNKSDFDRRSSVGSVDDVMATTDEMAQPSWYPSKVLHPVGVTSPAEASPQPASAEPKAQKVWEPHAPAARLPTLEETLARQQLTISLLQPLAAVW